MAHLRSFVGAALLAAVFGAQPGMAQPRGCNNADLLSNFETGRLASGFAKTQNQRGDLEVVADPARPGNHVAFLSADRKRSMMRKKVGKAALIHRFSPLPKGTSLVMAADFYIPKGSSNTSIILMDLECASCIDIAQPGIRLYLKQGRLRVDLSKIGLKHPYDPQVAHQIVPGRWYNIEWRVTVGAGQGGSSEVYLDGKLVNQARGNTLLTQKVASGLQKGLVVKEQVDRFQVGMTANSNKSRSDLLMDNVWFCRL